MKRTTWTLMFALLTIAVAPLASANEAAYSTALLDDEAWCGGAVDANCYYCSYAHSMYASLKKHCDNGDDNYVKTLCAAWAGMCLVGGGAIEKYVDSDARDVAVVLL